MRLVLTGRRLLEVRHDDNHAPVRDGEFLLRVLYCGVCRTDVKMWDQGHRDLILPRVPGHEIVAVDSNGRRYVVWPGDSCGDCDFCRNGRENLCRRIRIMGFHRDGGFSDRIVVPRASLIPVPETMDTIISCLAEPAGCVLHALDKCRLKKHARVLIYGGGVMGLLCAMAAVESGAIPIVVEKNVEKRRAAERLLGSSDITCLEATREAGFDAVINACADATAFHQGVTMLGGGGCFCFFSGLAPDRALSVDLINRIHYNEIIVAGSYGLTRSDMRRALGFLQKWQLILTTLIQSVVVPEDAPGLMPRMLSGDGFKYVLKFSDL